MIANIFQIPYISCGCSTAVKCILIAFTLCQPPISSSLLSCSSPSFCTPHHSPLSDPHSSVYFVTLIKYELAIEFRLLLELRIASAS